MRKEGQKAALSPLALEAWIMLITLVIGILLLGIVHKKSQAQETMALEQRSLTLALMDAAEQIKADPEGDGNFVNDVQIRQIKAGEITVIARITRSVQAGGSFYTIQLAAGEAGGEPQCLNTGIYRPREVIP